MPESDPSVTQVAPVFAAGDLVAPIRISGPVTMLWWAVGYNGNTDASNPVPGTGASIDARLVVRQPGHVGRVSEYLGYTPISVTLGATIALGRVAHEIDLPESGDAWLILSTLTIGASAASHLWLSYRLVRRAP